MEGQQETIFLWVSSGRWETIVVFGMLSAVMRLLFWSEIVDPGNRRTRRVVALRNLVHIPAGRTVFYEFLDRKGGGDIELAANIQPSGPFTVCRRYVEVR
jgi:hypothetical protein